MFRNDKVNPMSITQEVLIMINNKAINNLKKNLDVCLTSGSNEHEAMKRELVVDLQEFIVQKSEEYRSESDPKNEEMHKYLSAATDHYFNMYESAMRDSSEEGAISETDFMAKHKEVKSKIMESFKENELDASQSFGSFLPKLEQMIDKSYEEFLKPFQISTELTDVRPKARQQTPKRTQNEMHKYIIAILHLVTTPQLDFLFYLVQDQNSSYFFLIASAFFFSFSLTVAFNLTFSCKMAHNSRSTL